MMESLYQLIFIEPWPWWLGGLCIGLLVPGMYYFLNTPLGVSTGYGSYLKLVLPTTKLGWLNSKTFTEKLGWRIFFLAGIVLGAFISARLSGNPLIISEMGRFTQLVHWSMGALALWFFAGGLLLGLGSRISGGCTSGHSIHGLANFHASSLVATVFYLLFGTLTVQLIKIYLLGGM